MGSVQGVEGFECAPRGCGLHPPVTRLCPWDVLLFLHGSSIQPVPLVMAGWLLSSSGFCPVSVECLLGPLSPKPVLIVTHLD